ncbi:ankyrin repeat domain-containing protein [Vibrio sp. VB16]|uniref:ankyrin repeat domain-containing protein n=1 Tax=Vibrio sp. VB16 TaxID=2785746 RepID=UPI00189EA92B|nr:ankyrin repeat domain-containing protein [Vibrio sp. VB16]UGA56578.1 ankyrin repeat domain-containing protein [Vibrio sp. VB16]
MRNWNDYKTTYRSESDIFDFARVGDFRGLVNILSQHTEIDLDAKNNRGYSPLMLAVYNGERDFCEALLRSGADVNSMDFMKNTVLMASAFKGNVEIIKLLLQFGAITTNRNKTNMNVRDWALMFGRTEVVQYLDNTLPTLVSASKIKNFIRFIGLSFLMLKPRIQSKNRTNRYS